MIITSLLLGLSPSVTAAIPTRPKWTKLYIRESHRTANAPVGDIIVAGTGFRGGEYYGSYTSHG